MFDDRFTQRRPAGSPVVRAYATTFRDDENPISEGGLWLNGRKDGIDWIDVVAANGVAYGEISRMTGAERRAEQGNLAAGDDAAAPVGDYDDPTAVLSGAWGRNQHAVGEVFCRNPTEEYFQEVQFRLRAGMAPNWCTGYEIFWRVLRHETAYAEIVRWNGKVGDFTSIQRHMGAEYGLVDGDLIEATAIGNTITGYVNGKAVITVDDDALPTGAPGIGFNFYVGTTNVDHGFSSFAVETWDD